MVQQAQRHCVLGSFLLAMCVASAANAQAKPDPISGDIIRATTLTGAQQTKISEFVGYWATKLINGESTDVAEARGELIGPLKKGGTQLFNDTYGKEVAGRLTKAVESDKVLVRINGMIVAKELMDEKVDDIIKIGLKDESAPGRYLAGKVAANVLAADEGLVNGGRKAAIYKMVADAMKLEKSPWVFEELARALIAYGQTPGYITVLERINDRTDRHAAKLTTEISVDLSLLSQLFNNLVVTIARQGKQVDRDVLVAVCKTTYRLAWFAVNARDKGVNDSDIDSALSQIVDLSSDVLPYIVQKIDPTVRPPAPWKRQQVPLQKLALSEFPAILIGPSFGLTKEELEVKAPGE